MTKSCLICGKQFDTNHSQVVCCSDVCKKIRARQLHKIHNNNYRKKALSKAEQRSLQITGKIIADKIKQDKFYNTNAEEAPLLNWQVTNPAVIELRARYRRSPRKIFIPAAIKENRKPTVDELLDWIFSKE